MSPISILILIIGIILCLLGFTNVYKKIEYNKQQEDKNKALEIVYKNIENNIKTFTRKEDLLKEEIRLKIIELEKVTERLNNSENTSKEAFEKYCEILEESYVKVEQDFEKSTKELSTNFQMKQQDFLVKLGEISDDLQKLKNTRAAAMEALRKEKEIEAQEDYYSLDISADDLDDIQTLERVKSKLHQPRILCMLIWSTYFQKPMTALCNKLLGTSIKIGIYKITNQITKECYIGQSVDISKRWKEHAKCGLGIDTPASNKLYKSMIENGLQHFTFELLEECSKDQLNEKEKFYIELYQANEFGFNSTGGNK